MTKKDKTTTIGEAIGFSIICFSVIDNGRFGAVLFGAGVGIWLSFYVMGIIFKVKKKEE